MINWLKGEETKMRKMQQASKKKKEKHYQMNKIN